MFEVQSCVRGYHVYQNVWTSYVGKVLSCAKEPRNPEDPYAVATKTTSGTVVGHVPCSLSCIFVTFLCHGRSISCTITGSRRYSSDLPQGGLELPCTYAFVSDNQRLLQKARKRLEEEGTRVANVTQGGDVASVVGLATNKIESSISTACSNTNNIAPVTSAVTMNDTSATVTKTTSKCYYVIVEHSYAAEPLQLPDTTMIQSHTDSELINHNVLRVKDISLMNDDGRILETEEMLTDKHINFAQRLLKLSFPEINLLRLTVLQDKEHKEPTTNSIQILHVNGNHWVCAATTAKGKQVNVYDSSFGKWDQASYKALQTQFHCSSCNINFVKDVQKQIGTTDCGLFAIANATTIAFKGDPSQTSYDQSLMRDHLLNCFITKTMKPFP